MTDFGTIQGGATTNSGIYLAAGGSVTNGSSALKVALVAAGDDGVHIDWTSGTVTNFGTVDGRSLEGIFLEAGRVVVTNHRLIEGGISGIYLGSATSLAKIVNFGTISGAVGVAVAAGDTAGPL